MGFLDFLTGGGLGAIAGAASGIASKVMDLQMRKRELEQRAMDHAHELALRDKDREMAAQEAASQLKVHQVDADAQATMADLGALQASFSADKAAYGDSRLGCLVDFLRGVTRPLVTYASVAMVGYVTVSAMMMLGGKMSAEQAERIVGQGTFIASMAISWWFAARPGKLADFVRR